MCIHGDTYKLQEEVCSWKYSLQKQRWKLSAGSCMKNICECTWVEGTMQGIKHCTRDLIPIIPVNIYGW